MTGDPIALALAGFAAWTALIWSGFLTTLAPRGGVSGPRDSRCPRCGASIPALARTPLLGWLLVRGRCRGCGVGVPLAYPASEAAGLLFVLVILCAGGPPERLIDLTALLPALGASAGIAVLAGGLTTAGRAGALALTAALALPVAGLDADPSSPALTAAVAAGAAAASLAGLVPRLTGAIALAALAASALPLPAALTAIGAGVLLLAGARRLTARPDPGAPARAAASDRG